MGCYAFKPSHIPIASEAHVLTCTVAPNALLLPATATRSAGLWPAMLHIKNMGGGTSLLAGSGIPRNCCKVCGVLVWWAHLGHVPQEVQVLRKPLDLPRVSQPLELQTQCQVSFLLAIKAPSQLPPIQSRSS
jgi:hypothetical protein